MSAYFIDTEFHEFKKKPLFSKPIDTIELISIGIVSEGINSKYFQPGRRRDINGNIVNIPEQKEYYAICKEFDVKAAWNNEWLRENVLKPIFNETIKLENDVRKRRNIELLSGKFTIGNLRYLIKVFGKTKKQIAEEIKQFVHGDKNIEFYGYYADYDHVVLSWLYGRMIDLPKGFPMYTRDLKQISDETLDRLVKEENNKSPLHYTGEPKWSKYVDDYDVIKKHPDYPKQENAHNALSDAKWNYKLYKFLQQL